MLRWLIWLVLLPVWLPVRVWQGARAWLRPKTALVLRLKGPLLDSPAGAGPFGQGLDLLSVIQALASAEQDARLRSVVVRVDGYRGGLARAEELRVALGRVRRAGKRVIVVADHLSLSEYWLALGADRIYLSPTGALDVSGVASEFSLLKGLLDKLGVRARLLAKGRYKSMREVFSEDRISPENREMLREMVGDLFEQLAARIGEARDLSAEQVRERIDRGPFRAEEALELGLIDQLEYPAKLGAELEDDAAFRPITPEAYLARRRRTWLPTRRRRVALIEVDGSITMGDDSFSPSGKRSTGARSFVTAVQRVQKDRSVAAILLRVNSPGGSALASDLMWNALGRAKGDRPLIVSMANVAASGGYYVSGVRGAKIVASPCTITGSIGVVGGKVELSGLYDKLGVKREVVQVGKNASFHSPSSDWDDAQLEKMSRDIDALYADFVAKMADGRALGKQEIEAAAQGRVWTGTRARDKRLVDELGGYREAIDLVLTELGLVSFNQIELVFTGRPSFLQLIRARLNPAAGALVGLLGGDLGALSIDPDGVQREWLWCRLPFDLELR